MKEDQERTPLRTILTNFLNHIENLEARRSTEDSYETEFQELKLFSESIKGTKQYSTSEGEKEVNRKKNRYKDILPFDISRVSLNEYAGIPGSDYINANFIKGASGSPAYIASQGPLPNTVNDFWRMVVQCEVQVIIMACNEEEAGKHKCENYWVEGDSEEKQFGMVSIRLIKASTVCPDFSVRTMRLKYTNSQSVIEERTVCQFHYSAWPDHGVPPLVRPLLDMVRLVRDTQASETLPVLVHCSAGCGRTGTICAIDYVWGLLRAGKLTTSFSLLSLVREMRKQRIAMVQTKEQYVLVHQAVRELFKEQLRMIDSHPYENIDCNGLPLIKPPSPDSDPTYDTISKYQPNNVSEEKQDEKEKEIPAPPIPQKKKFILSSKHEKEVENLSERQRLVEQAGSSSESVSSSSASGHRPRIAKLKSFFERNSATRESRRNSHVSRSHSLGAVRNSRPVPSLIQPEPPAVEIKSKEQAVKDSCRPIPCKGILRVPQITDQPVLPVKRSKSLRVLGTGDRYKLSIPAGPPPTYDIDIPLNSVPEKTRRLSLESNIDEMRETERKLTDEPIEQNSQDYLSVGVVDAIVAGLGVRERRNSFRQAMNSNDIDQSNSKSRKDYEMMWVTPLRRPGLLRSYTSIDMRTVHAQSLRQNVDIKAGGISSKPVLRPKPFVFYDRSPKSSDKTPHMSSSKSGSCAPKQVDQQTRKVLNQSQPSYLTSSYQNNPRPLPRQNKLGEIKPDVTKQSYQISREDRTDFTKQRDLPNTFKNSYSADKEKILHPTYCTTTAYTPREGAPQTTVHHAKSLSTPKNTMSKQSSSLDPRFCENVKESPVSKTGEKSKHSVKSSEGKAGTISQLESRPDFSHSTYIRHNPIPVQQKPAYSKPVSYSQEMRHPQNIRHQQMVASSSNVHPQNRKGTQNVQFQSPSTSRPVIYDSRSGRQEAPIVYRTRPKAPPSYNEASRQTMLNKSQVLVQKSMPQNSACFDPRYASPHLPNQHVKLYESRLIHQDAMHIRDPSQFQKLFHDIDDRKKNSDVRETRKYLQINNQEQYSRIVNESRSNQSSSPDTKGSDMRSNLQSTQDISTQSNSKLIHDSRSRTHDTKSNQPNSQDTKSHEIKTLQDSGLSQQYTQHSSKKISQGETLYRPQPTEQSSPESDALSHGVKLRRGSRDDLALCSNLNMPSRVKRHASVVMLRHSVIENSNSSGSGEAQPVVPLTVWNQNSKDGNQVDNLSKDPWSGAVGVDLDQVAASIPLKDGTSTKFMRAALESLHLRKGTSPQMSDNAVETKSSPRSSGSSQPPLTFRKQQQYL